MFSGSTSPLALSVFMCDRKRDYGGLLDSSMLSNRLYFQLYSFNQAYIGFLGLRVYHVCWHCPFSCAENEAGTGQVQLNIPHNE